MLLKRLLLGVLAIAFMAISSFSVYFSRRAESQAAQKPIARSVAQLPAGALEPSAAFMQRYSEQKALLDEITALEKDFEASPKGRLLRAKRDQANGIGLDLIRAIPPGYQWDDKLLAFTPKPAPKAP